MPWNPSAARHAAYDGGVGSGGNLRVGDAERETAIKALGEHLTAGRLDVGEYDQRCADAVAARFQSDLRALFADLPNTVAPPAPAPPVAPQRRRAPVRRLSLGIVLLLVCLAAMFKLTLLAVVAAAVAAVMLLRR